jgi:hypothetical protein
LEFHRKYPETLSNAGVIARVTDNSENIQNVLLQSLESDRPHLFQTIAAICDLDTFSRSTGHGHLPMLDHIPKFLPQPMDPKLEAYFTIQLLSGWCQRTVQHANKLISQAQEHFKPFDDPDMMSELIPHF